MDWKWYDYSLWSAKRASNNLRNYNHVFLNGNLENQERLTNQLLNINSKLIIHTGLYKPINLKDFEKNKKYLVFSGIGNHQTFVSMVRKNGLQILKDIEFADHYSYTKKDINKILKEADNLNCKVITTEKDFLRIENLNTNKIKFIKSELQIIDEDKLINSII